MYLFSLPTINERLCVVLQVMGQGYLQQRRELVEMALGLGRRLQLKDETIHDAVLLMDRVMSTGVRVRDPSVAVTRVSLPSLLVLRNLGFGGEYVCLCMAPLTPSLSKSALLSIEYLGYTSKLQAAHLLECWSL